MHIYLEMQSIISYSPPLGTAENRAIVHRLFIPTHLVRSIIGRLWGAVVCLMPFFPGRAQSDTFDISAAVFMEPFVVSETRGALTAVDFVRLVREDESFYRAFRHLRTATYHFDTELVMLDKRRGEAAYYRSSIQQHSDGDCRFNEVIDQVVRGQLFKRGEPRFYTYKLYDRLSLTRDTVCESTVVDDAGKLTTRTNQLKQLVFSPGQAVDVPFFGEKLDVFSEERSRYYDYTIDTADYRGTSCYVFRVAVKPEYQKRKEDKTVLKHLATYFRRDDFQVVARDYRLRYDGFGYDFDVAFTMRLRRVEGRYLPTYLAYEGNWNIPFRRREIGRFEVRLDEFDF